MRRATPVRDEMRRRRAARRELFYPDLAVESLDVGGLTRTFVSVPGPGPDAPLLLALHGATGTGMDMAALSGLHTRAAAAGCAVIFPDGIGRVWNAGPGPPRSPRRQGVDDVAFLAALVDHARRTGLSDGHRVFAVGVSNGGMLAEYVARHGLLDLEGVVLVAASATAASRRACVTPRRPVRFLAFHGTADPLVPYAGRAIGVTGRLAQRRRRGGVAPIEQVCADWARPGAEPVLDALPPASVTGDLRVERVRWADPLGSSVTLYRVRGGGHTWPGGPQYLSARIIGPVARGLDATGIMLDFVAGPSA
ncbi:MAG TPA: hypothetical protein VGG09_11380 [Acidimicrobiales bacterium]